MPNNVFQLFCFFLFFQMRFQYLKFFGFVIYFSMRSGHRRTPAKPAEDNYRFSVPVNYQPPLQRLSFEPQQLPPQLYRVSDLSYLTAFHAKIPSKATFPEKQEEKRTGPKLMETFNSLQQKLAQATKQLNSNKTHSDRKGSQFELKSWKGLSCQETPEESSFFAKIDESTINLQSHKKLMMLKSESRLPWANKIKSYYISEVAKGMVGLNNTALQHINLSHQVLRASKSINLPDHNALPRTKVHLPQAPEHKGRKVLVLDLDQTLFHSSDQRACENDIQVDIPCEQGHEKVYIALRPFAISFLKKMNKQFEVIAFTASERTYADAILDELDPDRQLIHHRLYRDHCVKLNPKIYAKDLSILDRDLSQVILVDNSPLSYLYQLQNGVPILPYYGGEDNQLLQLEKYLGLMKKEEDVRGLNRKMFKLESYWYFNDVEELVNDLYCDSMYF